MTPKSTRKTIDYCDSSKNPLCPEIIELRVIVKNIGESVIDMQHLILGNGKDGMKVEQSKQSDAIKQMDAKLDLVLAEQKIISDERIARAATEVEKTKQKQLVGKKQAEEKANKQWTARWVLGLIFDKFSVPALTSIITAVAIYWLLGK